MNSARTLFDPYDYTGHALDLAYMFLGFWHGDAIGPGSGGQEYDRGQQKVFGEDRRSERSARNTRSLDLSSPRWRGSERRSG